MKDKAARAVRSRRKMLAKRYSRRMGQRCVWLDGALVVALRRPGHMSLPGNHVPVHMKGGKAVSFNKQGEGTGAAQRA